LSTWDRERRVCIEKRFPAYFGFGIGDEAISSEELRNFIANITDREYVGREVAAGAAAVRRSGGTKAAVLLEELISNVELVPADNIPGAVASLFDVTDLFANSLEEHGGGFLHVPAIWRFWFLMKRLLERLNEPTRAEALRAAFDRASSLRGLCFALTVFRTSLGRDLEAKPEDAGPPLVDAAVFEDLEKKLRIRLRTASQDGSLIAGRGLVENLLEWSRLAGEAEVHAWTDTVLDDDIGILQLAVAATQFSRTQTVGDRVVRLMPMVDRPTLEKVVNAKRMAQRLVAIAEAGPAPESHAVISNFVRGLKTQLPFPHGKDDNEV
jgi:hypothetical protein